MCIENIENTPAENPFRIGRVFIFTFIILLLLISPIFAKDPYISSYKVRPSTANPGDTVTLKYKIKNPNSYGMYTILGASIRDPNGKVIDDESHDKKVWLSANKKKWYSRKFKIPSNAKSGKYDVYWAIWEANWDWDNRYDGTGWKNNKLTVKEAECKVTSCKWSPSGTVTEGDKVKIKAKFSGCTGKKVYAKIYDIDPSFGLNADDLVTKLKWTNKGDGRKYVKWKTKWYEDTDGANPDPEYVFRIVIDGEEKCRASNEIKVEKDCNNECSYEGQRKCSGSREYKKCKKDSNGCLYWKKYYCDSDEECKNGECVRKEKCKVNNAYWSESSVTEGDKVRMKVRTNTACNGKSVKFKIYEDDPAGDDYVTTKSGKINSGYESVKWYAEWQDDGWGGDPEYYFKVYIDGDYKKKSGNLDVEKDCNDECKKGERECVYAYDGIGRYKVCEKDKDGCWKWSNEKKCKSDEMCKNGECVKKECKVTNCKWSPSGDVNEGDEVKIKATFSGCKGKKVYAKIYDIDPPFGINADDYVYKIIWTNKGDGDKQVRWNTKWYEDTDGADPDPEYIFRVFVDGKEKCRSSNQINVKRACEDECKKGEKKCTNVKCTAEKCPSQDYYQECGDFDNDRCTEWGKIKYCGKGKTCKNGECVEKPCVVDSISWSKSKVIEGEKVEMNVKTKYCDGKVISAEIYEDDAIGDDYVTTKTGKIPVELSWRAEWQEDAGTDPEYYFHVYIDGKYKGKSKLLTVEQECIAQNCRWSPNGTVDDGTNVKIIADYFGECNGRKIKAEIFDYDWFFTNGNDKIEEKEREGSGDIKWKAIWTNDSDGGNPDPEYKFTIYVDGREQCTSPELKVNYKKRCGNGICDDNEDPVTCPSDCKPNPCNISNCRWSEKEVKEKSTVKLLADYSKECKDKAITAEIFEYSPSVNRSVDKKTRNGPGKIEWKAVWIDDLLFGGNPEYVFEISVDGQKKCTSDILGLKPIGMNCKASNCRWSETDVDAGTELKILADYDGECDGKEVSAEIFERDIIGNDYVTTKKGKTTEALSWKAEWQKDSGGDPEFYFNLYLDGRKQCASADDVKVKQVCRVKSCKWSKDDAVEDETVTIGMDFEGECTDKDIEAKIYEYDPSFILPDDYVGIENRKGAGNLSWKIEWKNDWIGNPEFVFRVYVDGIKQCESKAMKVDQKCKASSCRWSKNVVDEGKEVAILFNHEGNCSGSKASARVYSKSTGGDMEIDHVSDKVDGKINWKTFWKKNSRTLSEYPEYYFKIYIDGIEQNCKSNILEVRPIESDCKIGSVRWGSKIVEEGERAAMIVETNGRCNGKKLTLIIGESDSLSRDDFILRKDVSVESGTVREEWSAGFFADGAGKPEFYFTANIAGNEKKSGLLTVYKGKTEFSKLKDILKYEKIAIVVPEKMDKELEAKVGLVSDAIVKKFNKKPKMFSITPENEEDNCALYTELEDYAVIAIGSKKDNKIFACSAIQLNESEIAIQKNPWNTDKQIVWVDVSDGFYDNVVGLSKMIELGVNKDYNFWQASVACIATGDFKDTGSEIVCNVIPVVELAPDLRDSLSCIRKMEDNESIESVSPVDQLTCGVVHVATIMDIWSLPGYATVIVGVGEFTGDLSISSLKVALKNAGKKLMKGSKEMVEKAGKMVRKFKGNHDPMKDLFKFIKKNERLMTDDMGEAIIKVMAKDESTVKESMKILADTADYSWTVKGVEGISHLVELKKVVKVDYSKVSKKYIPRLGRLFSDGEFNAIYKIGKDSIGDASAVKKIKFIDDFDGGLKGKGIIAGMYFGKTGTIEIPVKNIVGEKLLKKVSYEDLQDITVHFVLPHELSHPKLNKLLGGNAKNSWIYKNALEEGDKAKYLIVTSKDFGEYLTDAVSYKTFGKTFKEGVQKEFAHRLHDYVKPAEGYFKRGGISSFSFFLARMKKFDDPKQAMMLKDFVKNCLMSGDCAGVPVKKLTKEQAENFVKRIDALSDSFVKYGDDVVDGKIKYGKGVKEMVDDIYKQSMDLDLDYVALTRKIPGSSGSGSALIVAGTGMIAAGAMGSGEVDTETTFEVKRENGEIVVTVLNETNGTNDNSPVKEPEQEACRVKKAYWSEKEAAKGDIVKMTVETTSGCNGKKMKFEIYEDDPGWDEYVTTKTGKVEDGIASIEWKVKWLRDSIFFGFEGSPEYYFQAYIEGDPTRHSRSRLLYVKKKCKDECNKGEKKCSGGDGYKVCVKGSKGCYVWGSKNYCSSDKECDNGKCVKKKGCKYHNPDCSSGYECRNNKCVKIPCKVTNCKWDPKRDVDEGTNVKLKADFSECNGNSVDVKIYDSDWPLSDGSWDLVDSLSWSISGSGTKSKSWKSIWKEDTDGATPDPEYVFRIWANGEVQCDSGSAYTTLNVKKKCDNECSSGDKKCSGSSGYKKCEKDKYGCWKWSSKKSCGSNEECKNGKCVKKEECKVTDAYWSKDSATEGDKVYMRVKTNSVCNGKSVKFKIYEDDPAGDDYVTTKSGKINSGYESVKWYAEWQDDGIGGDPEYYFQAYIDDKKKKKSKNLNVEKKKDCTSGPCCDNEKFRPSSYVCDNRYKVEYGCPWGTGAGADVGKRTMVRYCSGSSNSCDGRIEWKNWVAYDRCNSKEYCKVGEKKCQLLEGCKYDNPKCGPNEECKDNKCVKKPCKFNSAKWSKSEAKDGETVKMEIKTSYCNGKSVELKIYEDDLAGDDYIESKYVKINRDSTSVEWKARWQKDGLFGLGGKPEYYFVVYMNGQYDGKSGILKVKKR